MVRVGVTWVGTAPRNERCEEALTSIAQKIFREHADVDSVLISPTTVLLVKGTTAVRFLLSGEATAAVARHVEGGTGPFEPTALVLLERAGQLPTSALVSRDSSTELEPWPVIK